MIRLEPFPAALHHAVIDGSFAARSGLAVAPDWPNVELREALPFLAGLAEASPGWSFLIVEDGTVVGEIGLKGPPRHGVAEVGYGVCTSRRGRGCASTALALLIERVRGPVRELTAETMTGNTASERVLARAGFVPVKREPERTWWYLDLV